MGGALRRGFTAVRIERQQVCFADARVHGDSRDPRVGGEDGERELRLCVGGEPGVAAGAVRVAPLDGGGAVQRRGHVDDPAAGVGGECGFQEAGQQVVREEVDLQGDFVAVGGEGVAFRGGGGGVVDQDVEVRMLDNDAPRHGLDLLQTCEVRAECAELGRVDACDGDELVRGCLCVFGRAAVDEDGGTALGELPGGLVADAGGGAGHQDGTGGKVEDGHDLFRVGETGGTPNRPSGGGGVRVYKKGRRIRSRRVVGVRERYQRKAEISRQHGARHGPAG